MSRTSAAKDFQPISNCLPTPENSPSNSSEKKQPTRNSSNSKTTGGVKEGRAQSKSTGSSLSKTGSGTTLSSAKERAVVLKEAVMHAKRGNPQSPPLWINDWSLANHDPVPVSRETLDETECWLLVLMEPADPREGAAVMEHTLELYGMPDNWNRTVEFYLEVIEDLPLDIIIDAFRTIRQTSKWFPKPSEIRGSISNVFWQRQSALSRLRLMRERMEPSRPLFSAPLLDTQPCPTSSCS